MNPILSRTHFRTLAVCAACVAAPIQANALTLTIPTNFLNADSILSFSELGVGGFKALGISTTALGNTTEVSKSPLAYNLPVTKLTVQGIKPSGGSAIGSALELERLKDSGVRRKLVLANFVIDFKNKLVFADATYNGKTVASTSIFTFNEQTPLAIKYKFPLKITANQVLDQLFLTPEAQAAFKEGLDLPNFTKPILEQTDYGTITVDVKVSLRKKPISTRPYVPAP
jgi:hypothetical protein